MWHTHTFVRMSAAEALFGRPFGMPVLFLCCYVDEQVLGVHLGIRHLSASTLVTPDKFKDAAVAVHREDQMWTSPTDSYMAANCPNALAAISMWE